MNRKLSLFSLTALATLGVSFAANAAEWHYAPQQLPGAGLGIQATDSFRTAAETYLKASSTELRLDGVKLQYRNELKVGTHRTVRFTQLYKGLPVIGASTAVFVGPDRGVRASVLEVNRNLSVSPVPTLDEAMALFVVETQIGMSVPPMVNATLGVLPEHDGGGGKLVWTVDVPSAKGGHRYLVDAHSGLIVRERPLAVDALGRVYPISKVVTPMTQDVELLDLDGASPQLLNGWNGNLSVTNYVSGGAMGGLTLEQTVTANVGTDFLFDPPVDPLDKSDAFAQVGIYHHLTRMRDYFTNSLNLDMSAPSWRVVAVANMQEGGQPLDNAYFSPETVGAPWNANNLIAIGQGTLFDFSDDSDVFLHEFTHFVSHNAVGYNEGQLAVDEYGLSPWGGSIDEGIADYFACTVNGDPIVGEASLALVGAERNLADVSKVCPDDVIGEVHEDGELIGSLAWALRTAFGTTNGDQLVWGALTMLTTGSSFGDFSRALQMVAGSMVASGQLTAQDQQTLDSILQSRGLNDCDQVLDVSEQKPRKTTMFGLDIVSQLVGIPCQQLRASGQVSLHSLFHFKATPTAGDEGIRFQVDLQPQGGNDLEWNIYVRTGQHVGMAGGVILPMPTQFDYSVEKVTGTSAEIVIDANSNPPFNPGMDYYMVIGHTNCPIAQATVTTSAVTNMGQGGAGGSGGSGSSSNNNDSRSDDSGGCGCVVAGSDVPEAPWALSLLGLSMAAVLRRRRRAS